MIKQNGETMIRSNSQTAVPNKILQQVQQVQQSSQSRDRRYAWLVAGCVLATMMILAMIAEAQLNLFSHALRFALTVISLVAAATCGWFFWRRGERQNERLVSAAQQVDSTFPVLEERVSTLTSCEEDRLESRLGAHPAMLNRLAVEASRIHEDVESKPIVSQKMLKRPLRWLAAAGLVLLGLFAWDAPKTMVQLGRFWAPWANLSVTGVSSVERNSVVARHEPIKLTATLDGRAVEELQVVSRSVGDQALSKTRIWASSKDPSVATFRQSKATESFDYRFRAGDGQTDWHRVTVADRPKIENLTMRIVPPAYTGKKTKTFKKLPKKLQVVKGSQLEIEVKPKTGVRTARLVMGKTDWLPMELAGSGGAYVGSMEPYQSINFEVQLTEVHGLVNRRPPRCRLQVVSDQAPRVRIVRPTKSTVLLPDESIDIHFKANDDFGIKEMALRVYTLREGEEQPTVHEVPIPLDEETNRRKIKGSVALDLDQFGLKDGDTIRYEIRASDNFVPLETPVQGMQTQPMKDVQLSQNAEAEAMVPNGIATPNLAEAVDPSTKVAQSLPAQSTKDPKVPSERNNDVSMKTTQANASTSPEQNSQPQDGQAQSAPNNSTNENQVAANSPASKGAKQTNQTNQLGEPKSSQTDSDGRAGSPKAAKKSEQPTADKMAESSGEPNAASNENKIGAKQETNSASAEADPTSMAKSDSAIKQGVPNESDLTGQPNKAASSSAKRSNQASSGQQASSQQASQSPNSSNNQSKPNSSGQDKMAANKTEKPDSENSDPSESPELTKAPEAEAPKSDPVKMALRTLDVGGGQSSSSGQQQIKVDQYAGGFTSDHRTKLEIAIAPVLELLKSSLESAGQNVRQVMNSTSANPITGSAAANKLQDAGSTLDEASKAVIGLNQKTKNTPYAFVGLRLESIRTADVAPAGEDVQSAIDAVGKPRLDHASSAWNHISRALATLEKLEAKYEEVKRSLKRADDIQKFKKMYNVFIENSMAMLNPDNFSGGGPSRKSVEFDLDEEYLKRLKEVLQMRQEMMAELARILDDDPQLLRRFMNSMNSRNSTIRSQLTLIAADQRSLAHKINLWADAINDQQDLADHVTQETEQHLAGIQDLANRLADLQDAFVSWLPLAEDVKKGDAAEAMENFKAAGCELTAVSADVEAILTAGDLSPDYRGQVAPVLTRATGADKLLAEIGRSLQRMSNDQTNFEIANNATRRLPALQKIRFDTQQWVGQLELLRDGQVHELYSVDQENRRDQLLEYSIKIASLEGQLAAALPGEDGTLPEDLAMKTKELLKLLDVDLPAKQLIAAQTLSDGQESLSKLEQSDIVENFSKAEKLFDEILQAVADELDKLPVQDPIASLLEDPTLDEILAQLENELDFLEELGLGRRPSNLQTNGGWRSSRMSSMMQALMAQQQRMRNLSNQAYRNALARAKVKNKGKKPKLAKDDSRWNLLVGQLDEDMLQGDKKVPPERYRTAIEQYFEKISKLKAEQDSE